MKYAASSKPAAEFAARFPALALWQREVRAGLQGQDAQRPGTWKRDTLYRAACLEAAAADLYGQGCLTTPQRLCADARRVVRDAATGKAT